MSVRNRVINPLVRALLRSPAHRVMSRGVLLLTYTGRRSGRRYALPVQLRLAGRELHGTAQVLVDALTIFLARFPNARRALGVSADASPDAIKQATEHQIVVRIATDDHPGDPPGTELV